MKESLPIMIENFIKCFPNLTKEECETISEIISWSDEKKLAFKIAKSIFEEDEDE